jgi:hypothetical protein
VLSTRLGLFQNYRKSNDEIENRLIYMNLKRIMIISTLNEGRDNENMGEFSLYLQ